MIWLRQSTASQEVPLGYFVDSTDGNTEETGLTIANTDIKVWKTGATTLANKNSGGATHISTGIYYAVLDATDTDTIGPLVIFVHVSGALTVRLECCVLDEAVYDALFGTTALATATNITSAAGITLADNAVAAAKIATGAITSAKFAAGAIDAAAIATGAVDADALAADAVAEIADGVWDEATAGHVAAGSFGKLGADVLEDTGTTLQGEVDGIQADTEDIQSRLPAALTADGNIKADTLRIGGTLQTANDVGGDVNDILADTGTDGVVVAAGSKTGYALSAAGVQAVWDALTAALTTAGSIGKRLVDLFSGMTSLPQWIGLLAGKQGGNATANTEINATGSGSGTYNETTDSLQAVRDHLADNMNYAPDITSILSDTNELQTDLTNGGRLDLLIDAIKAKADLLPESPAKNAQFIYEILMVDSTDHVTPETGLTITFTRDVGAGFAAATGSIAEVANGYYRVTASAADMNGDFVMHRFAATGADTLSIGHTTVS